VDNVVKNVCAESSYDRLHIDEALGFWKSDSNKNKKKSQRAVFVAIRDPFQVQKKLKVEVVVAAARVLMNMYIWARWWI